MEMNQRLAGMAIAAAAAALFMAGCSSTGTSTVQADSSGTVKVKCYGANACKGQAECKTAMNACKGQNSCKGHGFVSLTEQACLEHFGRA
jgi:uncharacterized membrane protein